MSKDALEYQFNVNMNDKKYIDNQILKYISSLKHGLNKITLIKHDSNNNIITIKYKDKTPYFNKYQSTTRIITIFTFIENEDIILKLTIKPYQKDKKILFDEAKIYWSDFVYGLYMYLNPDQDDVINKFYEYDELVLRLRDVNSHKIKIMTLIKILFIGCIVLPSVTTLSSLLILDRSIDLIELKFLFCLFFFASIIVSLIGTIQIRNEKRKIGSMIEKGF